MMIQVEFTIEAKKVKVCLQVLFTTCSTLSLYLVYLCVCVCVCMCVCVCVYVCVLLFERRGTHLFFLVLFL